MSPYSLWKTFITSIRPSLPQWSPLSRVLFLLTFSILVAPGTTAFAATGTALHVLVSYGSAADGYPRAFTGRFLKLQAGTGAGLSGKSMGTVSPSMISLMNHVTADSERPASALIADLVTKINSQIATMTSTMVAAMRDQNAATGILEWKQDVLLPNSQKGVLTWRLMVDTGGGARYGSPEVVPAEALTLDVVYTPLSLSSVLPASWPKYADAGLLKWRLIDKTGAARTTWVSVDAAGAFDDPESTTTESIDPDAGLKCLIQDRTLCGGPTDIKTLMDQQGAVGAYVSYTRRLTPVYDDVADPSHPGQYIQQPRISMTVDNRELRSNGCGKALTYRNQGAYGYTLAANAEKYLVDASLRYYPVDRTDQARISPTALYDKSIPVSLVDSASIISKIISPATNSSDLVNVSDVVGLLYLAPVSKDTSGNAAQGSGISSPYDIEVYRPVSIVNGVTVAKWGISNRFGYNSGYELVLHLQNQGYKFANYGLASLGGYTLVATDANCNHVTIDIFYMFSYPPAVPFSGSTGLVYYTIKYGFVLYGMDSTKEDAFYATNTYGGSDVLRIAWP